MTDHLCTCCGAPSDHDQSEVLVAVCNVLVTKALETVGKWIVRIERSRFKALDAANLRVHQAHTRWPVPDGIVDRALRGAWDVVPAMLDQHGCCGVESRAVVDMLDQYVHDLVITGTPHTLAELHYRFEARLGLVVYVALREASHA